MSAAIEREEGIEPSISNLQETIHPESGELPPLAVFNHLLPICSDYGAKNSSEFWEGRKSRLKRTGKTQAVAVLGLPGSGKTRTVGELIQDCEKEGIPWEYVEIGRSIARAKQHTLPDGTHIIPPNHIKVPGPELERNYRIITILYEWDVKRALRKFSQRQRETGMGGFVFYEALGVIAEEKDAQSVVIGQDDGTSTVIDVNAHMNVFENLEQDDPSKYLDYDASNLMLEGDWRLQEMVSDERKEIVIANITIEDIERYKQEIPIIRGISEEQRRESRVLTLADIHAYYWGKVDRQKEKFRKRKGIEISLTYEDLLQVSKNPELFVRNLGFKTILEVVGPFYQDRLQRIMGISTNGSEPNVFVGYNIRDDKLRRPLPAEIAPSFTP